MKKYLLTLFAALWGVAAFSQSVDGDWYLIYRNNLRHLKIAGDTIYGYSNPNSFNNLDSLTIHSKVADKAVILKRETIGTVLKLLATELNKPEGEDEATKELMLEIVEGKYPQLLFTIVDNTDDNEINLPLRLVTFDELKSYTKLKNVADMGEKEFIAFANKSIALKQKWQESGGVSRQYLISEIKHILAGMGYNPLITMNEIGQKLFGRFTDNPNTKELVQKMGN
jgi:hypothetical protein